MAVLSAVAFVALCGGLLYVWQEAEGLATTIAAIDPARVAGTEAQVQAQAPRIAALERRTVPSPPPPVDLGPLTARLEALEKRVAALPPPPPPPPPVDLGPLTARLDALETRVAALPPPPDLSAATAPLAAQLHALQSDGAAMRQAMVDGTTTIATRLAAAEQRISAAESRVAALTGAASAHADAALGLARAAVALAAGQPLGDIPGAPTALARFAHDAPPTEAALRLGFADAAARAEAASAAEEPDASAVDKMVDRAASLVSVRHGDTQVVGTPAGAVLAAARVRLDAGDLTGAVGALDGLSAAGREAMGAWLSQAKALRDARAALVAMARG